MGTLKLLAVVIIGGRQQIIIVGTSSGGLGNPLAWARGRVSRHIEVNVELRCNVVRAFELI